MRGEVDTAELSDEQAKAIEDRLSSLPEDKAAAPGHPDGFQYILEFPDVGGDTRSIMLDESEVGDDLRPLIQLAMERATLG